MKTTYALSIQYVNEHPSVLRTSPLNKGRESPFSRGSLVEIKGVEPFLLLPYTGISFQYILWTFALSQSGCKCTTFFKPCKKKNNFFSNASEVILSQMRMQTYNLSCLTSKTFFKNSFSFKTTLSVSLKADAKIKPISFTIQDKIQKIFRELICFNPLLQLG